MKTGPHDQTILRHLAGCIGAKEQTFRIARLCGFDRDEKSSANGRARTILKRLERYGLVDRPPYSGLMNPWWRITDAGRAGITL